MLTNVCVLLTVVFLTTAQNAGYTYAAPRNNNLEIDNTGYTYTTPGTNNVGTDNTGYTYTAPGTNNLGTDNTGNPVQTTNNVGSSNNVYTVQESNNIGIDEYNFQYTLSDGTDRVEEGKFVDGIWTVTGSSIWYDENGQVYILKFIADDQGFRTLPGGSGGAGGGISQNTALALTGAGK